MSSYVLVSSVRRLLGSTLPWPTWKFLRYDEIRQRQGLSPLVDPSALSQYRALCYHHISGSTRPCCCQDYCNASSCFASTPFYLLPPTVPPSLGITVARQVLSFVPLSSLSFPILLLPPCLNLSISLSLSLLPLLFFSRSFPLSFSRTLVDVKFKLVQGFIWRFYM